ncbi:hypothetical protein [Paenibacillus sp. YPG26]|uniref:hypothetical protein n=1 Tax=Paenibacillus sp. YPG26 TaxID=2878915 RepID=UPI00203DE190|nr:hypothetical protein [Paenibacillus sp. YPG26]USB33612.1 hypothetical protein LDO05_01945 [Paenibacillus sp. YPG26]
MADREKHYFARGNTAAGLYTLFDSVLTGLDTVFVLGGRAGAANARVLQELAAAWSSRGWSVHYIHQPLDSRLLEGVILEDARIGVVDGNAWGADPVLEGTEIRYVDLERILDKEILEASADELEELDQQISSTYNEAYATFHKTLRIHDDWEKFYIDNLDRTAANHIAEQLIEEYLIPSAAPAGEGNQQGKVVHRFLGAATWQGAIDYVPNLTEDMNTRIFVKGRPGSGKSTLFKKLAAEAQSCGIRTEIYHCGFDPNSLDMLIFPELSLAIFDSTAPHEHFPARKGDSVLDVYKLAIAAGTDEKYASEIAGVKSRYTSSMKEAIALLEGVKDARDRITAIYNDALDIHALHELSAELLREVDQLLDPSVLGSK